MKAWPSYATALALLVHCSSKDYGADDVPGGDSGGADTSSADKDSSTSGDAERWVSWMSRRSDSVRRSLRGRYSGKEGIR